MADLDAFGLSEDDFKPIQAQEAQDDLSAFGLTEEDFAPAQEPQPSPTAQALPAMPGNADTLDFPSRALTGPETEMLKRGSAMPKEKSSMLGEAYGQVVDMAAAFNRGIVGMADMPVNLFNIGSSLVGSDVRAAGLSDIPLVQQATRGGMGPEGVIPEGLELATEFFSGGGATQGVAKLAAKGLQGAQVGTRAEALKRGAEQVAKVQLAVDAKAAVGGGMASSAVNHSEILSDSTLAQILAPILGGTLAVAPVASLKAVGQKVIPGKQKQTRAGQVVVAAADDPDEAVRQLAQRQIVDTGAAAQTGDVGVMTLARSLARENPVFEGQLNDQMVMSQRAIQQELDSLFTPDGRPASPTAAQDFIKQNSDELIKQLDDRANAALESVQNIAMLGRGQINDIALSRQAKVQIEKAMRDVAVQRDALWNLVGKEVPVDTTPLRTEARKIVEEARKATELRGARRTLELIIGNKIKRSTTGWEITADPVQGAYGQTEPIGELIAQRSNLLAELRAESKDAMSTKLAPLFNRLQGAVIDSIDNNQVPPTFDALAYRTAADFTRRMHEVFDQGLVGRVLTSNTKAGEAVLSEKTLSTLLAGGREAQAAGAREITNIGMMSGQVGGQSAGQSSLLRSAQEYIASKFQRTVKNPEDAANFMLENEEAIRRFPQLRKTLTEAMNAIGIQSGKIENLQAGKAAIERSAFTKMAGMNGQKAVSTILKQRDPAQFAKQVRRLVSRDRDALRGIQRDIADMVLTRSLVGVNSIPQLTEEISKRALNRVITQMDPVIKAFYTPEMRGNLALIQKEVANLAALQSRTPRPVKIPRSMIGDLSARMLGAHFGTAVATGGGAGTSLLAARAGSEAGRQLIFAIPESATKATLEAAMLDRQLLTKLLKRGVQAGAESQQLRDALLSVIRQNVGQQAAQEFDENVKTLELEGSDGGGR